MASSFVLVYDNTPPAGVSLNINSGAIYANSQVVTAQPSTSDTPTTGYQMKIWGSVDTSANASIQATEGASAWITYSTSQPVTLSAGDGTKTLSVRVRDDVGNQIAAPATKSITLDTTMPVVNITVAPSPTKISKVATFDTTSFQFQVDSSVIAWKVKIVPSAGSTESQGVQIPTTGGSTNVTGTTLAATTNQIVTLKGVDVESASAGDGNKIVKVFAQDDSGLWSA